MLEVRFQGVCEADNVPRFCDPIAMQRAKKAHGRLVPLDGAILRAAVAVLLVVLGCQTPEPEREWREGGLGKRGALLVAEHPIEIGGAAIPIVFPDTTTRIVRLEADSHDLPLGTVLWARLEGEGEPRDFLLGDLLRQKAVAGTYLGSANWSERRIELGPGQELRLEIAAVDWDEAQRLFLGKAHGEPIPSTGVSGYPFNRVVRVPEPRTRVRLTVEVMAPRP